MLVSGCKAPETTAEPVVPSSVQTFTNVTLDSGFDTVITLVEQTSDQAAYQTHFESMCESFSYYNKLFDIYNSYEGINNLKTINDNAGIEPVSVDPELIELLDRAEYFYTLSEQNFDVTMGSLLRVWHNYRTEGLAANEKGLRGKIPSAEELKTAAGHRGFEYVEIDHDNNTVFITDPLVSIDAGGIAKGFATEKTAQKLEAEGCTHAAINAGGNNRTIGEKADGSTWNVGIQNPGGEGSILVVHISGTQSFVTSGDYERFYLGTDGKRYHHIIDAGSGQPASRYHSVTVITEDSTDADALSTALFTLSFEDGNALLDKYYSETGKRAEVIWLMDPDKQVTTTRGRTVGKYYAAYTEGLENKITWK